MTNESRIEKHSVGGSRTSRRTSRRTSPIKEITLDNLVQRVEEKRRRVNKQKPDQSTSQEPRSVERAANDFFLCSIGEKSIVEPFLSNSKNKGNGEKETLQESLQTLQNLSRLALTQPPSPQNSSKDDVESFKNLTANKINLAQHSQPL